MSDKVQMEFWDVLRWVALAIENGKKDAALDLLKQTLDPPEAAKKFCEIADVLEGKA